MLAFVCLAAGLHSTKNCFFGFVGEFDSESSSHELPFAKENHVASMVCTISVLPHKSGNTIFLSAGIGGLSEHVMCVWCMTRYELKKLGFGFFIAVFKFVELVQRAFLFRLEIFFGLFNAIWNFSRPATIDEK